MEIAGSTSVDDGTLEVRVDLTNKGDSAAASFGVRGDFLEASDEAKLAEPIAAGRTKGVFLRFPLGDRPGVHALLLLLEYQDGATLISQRAFLLIALGTPPPAAVRLSAPRVSLETEAQVGVAVESADGKPHRVELTLSTPRVLRALGEPVSVDVPAVGRAKASLSLLRAGAPRGTSQGILVVARSFDGALERDAAAAVAVDVGPDPALLPRLRTPLLVLAALLVLASLALEALRGRSRR